MGGGSDGSWRGALGIAQRQIPSRKKASSEGVLHPGLKFLGGKNLITGDATAEAGGLAGAAGRPAAADAANVSRITGDTMQ